MEMYFCLVLNHKKFNKNFQFNLYKEILKKTNCKLIASGGISSVSEIHSLAELGCEGAIIGKAIYEEKISLKELEKLC